MMKYMQYTSEQIQPQYRGDTCGVVVFVNGTVALDYVEPGSLPEHKNAYRAASIPVLRVYNGIGPEYRTLAEEVILRPGHRDPAMFISQLERELLSPQAQRYPTD